MKWKAKGLDALQDTNSGFNLKKKKKRVKIQVTSWSWAGPSHFWAKLRYKSILIFRMDVG